MSQITNLARITIEIDAVPLAPVMARMLGEVCVQQRLSAPTQCELVFVDSAGNFNQSAPITLGQKLRVSVKTQEPELFSGEVTAVEYVYSPDHRCEVHVRAYDLSHRLRKHQPVRAHVQVTLADLAREMASGAGLQVEALVDSPVWNRLLQHQQSDLDLLIEIAERCGMYFMTRGNTLYLFTLEGFGQPITLELGTSLFEARIEINGQHSCQSVSSSGWDPWHAEARSGQASNARLGRDISMSAPPSRVGSDGERTLTDLSLQEDHQAETMAQAELDWRAASEVTLWGVAEGNTTLQPGALVNVQGVADSLTGQYVLSLVKHTIDARRGYISEISTAPPVTQQKRLRTGATVVFGVISKINDPEELGRVQASLPALGDVETDWMQVLSLSGGSGKGLIMMPDIGDRVLVLCAGNDAAQGVVLGGLHGMDGLPDKVIGDGAVQRFTLCLPGGQRIQMDDSTKSIRLENSEGSFIEMLPDKVMLHSSTDLEIEAPGKSIVIRGDKIDFQRG